MQMASRYAVAVGLLKPFLPYMYCNIIYWGLKNVLRSRIINAIYRCPLVVQWLGVRLKHWFLDPSSSPLTGSSLGALSFWSSRLWHHPPNCSRAQSIWSGTPRATTCHKFSTRSRYTAGWICLVRSALSSASLHIVRRISGHRV